MTDREANRDRQVRVVLLSHTGELGGGELALTRLCAALDPSEVLVRVILFADGPLRERLEHLSIAVDVISLDSKIATASRYTAGRFSMANLRRAVFLIPFIWALVRRLRQFNPDVITTNSLKADLIGIPAAIGAGRPLVWYVHDRISEDYLPASMVRLVRRCAGIFPQVIIANSKATAATLLPHQSTVAYPGFAPEQALSDGMARRPPHSQVVGLIGRISPTKGQLEFVRAAARVLEVYPTARFRIVGAPIFGAEDYGAEVRSEAHALGINYAIDWIGFADDAAAELDRLTVFVHASPVPEPFGQVIVEAMIRRVPVIACRAGGAAEILEPDSARVALGSGSGAPTDQRLGVLVAPGDVDDLADAICEVLDDYTTAEQRAESAWLDAHQRFPIANTANRVTEVWKQAAGRRSPRPVEVIRKF